MILSEKSNVECPGGRMNVVFVFLESPDLVDVVLHHLRSVELHVSVGARAFPKQLVVVLVFVITSLESRLSVNLYFS